MTDRGWARDYVFHPVAALTRSPIAGILASMVVIGLWHELSFRYVLWGLYHGLGIACWRAKEVRQRASAFGSSAVIQ